MESFHTISHQGRLEVLEEHTTKITNILDNITTSITEMRMVMVRNNDKNHRAMEAMRRETNSSLTRLERSLAERP